MPCSLLTLIKEETEWTQHFCLLLIFNLHIVNPNLLSVTKDPERRMWKWRNDFKRARPGASDWGASKEGNLSGFNEEEEPRLNQRLRKRSRLEVFWQHVVSKRAKRWNKNRHKRQERAAFTRASDALSVLQYCEQVRQLRSEFIPHTPPHPCVLLSSNTHLSFKWNHRSESRSKLMKESQVTRIPLNSAAHSLTFTCHHCWLSCKMLSRKNGRRSPKIAPGGGGWGG